MPISILATIATALVKASESWADHQYACPRLQSAHLARRQVSRLFQRKGLFHDKREQAVTYDDFMQKTRSTLNGLGNIYRIPMEYVLQAVEPPQ